MTEHDLYLELEYIREDGAGLSVKAFLKLLLLVIAEYYLEAQ